jgi:hypothetical protein
MSDTVEPVKTKNVGEVAPGVGEVGEDVGEGDVGKKKNPKRSLFSTIVSGAKSGTHALYPKTLIKDARLTAKIIYDSEYIMVDSYFGIKYDLTIHDKVTAVIKLFNRYHMYMRRSEKENGDILINSEQDEEDLSSLPDNSFLDAIPNSSIFHPFDGAFLGLFSPLQLDFVHIIEDNDGAKIYQVTEQGKQFLEKLNDELKTSPSTGEIIKSILLSLSVISDKNTFPITDMMLVKLEQVYIDIYRTINAYIKIDIFEDYPVFKLIKIKPNFYGHGWLSCFLKKDFSRTKLLKRWRTKKARFSEAQTWFITIYYPYLSDEIKQVIQLGNYPKKAHELDTTKFQDEVLNINAFNYAIRNGPHSEDNKKKVIEIYKNLYNEIEKARFLKAETWFRTIYYPQLSDEIKQVIKLGNNPEHMTDLPYKLKLDKVPDEILHVNAYNFAVQALPDSNYHGRSTSDEYKKRDNKIIQRIIL